jgi:hypothetical protein
MVYLSILMAGGNPRAGRAAGPGRPDPGAFSLEQARMMRQR